MHDATTVYQYKFMYTVAEHNVILFGLVHCVDKVKILEHRLVSVWYYKLYLNFKFSCL